MRGAERRHRVHACAEEGATLHTRACVEEVAARVWVNAVGVWHAEHAGRAPTGG